MVVLVRCSFLVILVGAFVLGCVCRDMTHKTSHVNRQRKLREDVSDKTVPKELGRYARERSQLRFILLHENNWEAWAIDLHQ